MILVHSCLLQAPVDPLVDALSSSHGNYSTLRALAPLASTSALLQRPVYNLQHTNNITPQHSPVDPPALQSSREAPYLWTSVSQQANTNHLAPPPPSSWSNPVQHRRCSSGSSSSSDSGPTHLASVLSYFLTHVFPYPSPFLLPLPLFHFKSIS